MTEPTSPTAPPAPSTNSSLYGFNPSVRDIIIACWVGGLVLLVLGGLVAGASLPSFDLYRGDSGSRAGFLFGLGMVGLGQLAVLVGVIATGVRLGMDSATRGQDA